MKIKIIDLLNRIANNRFIPNKIKYHSTEYVVHTNIFGEFMIIDKDNRYMSYNKLNDEVEIIEEEKKIPEKISSWFSVEIKQSNEDNIKYANYNFETMYEKINEICDYLKSKGE